MTVFVSVDEPYKGVIPGKRPPLATNMYVEVQLSSTPLPDRFALPRSAVHENRIFLCTPENRLAVRKINTEFYMGELAVLSGGVEEGDVLVLSDLVPAVEGMKLKPDTDTETIQQIRAAASGEAP